MYSGHTLPNLKAWIEKTISLDFNSPREQQKDMEIDPPKNVNHPFLQAIDAANCYSRRSFEKWERIMHSHGASLREVFALRYGRFERYVDVVVMPGSTEHVEKIISLAKEHKVCLIPYGGGTNVT